jgi:hypothetical protein
MICKLFVCGLLLFDVFWCCFSIFLPASALCHHVVTPLQFFQLVVTLMLFMCIGFNAFNTLSYQNRSLFVVLVVRLLGLHTDFKKSHDILHLHQCVSLDVVHSPVCLVEGVCAVLQFHQCYAAVNTLTAFVLLCKHKLFACMFYCTCCFSLTLIVTPFPNCDTCPPCL